MSTGEPASGSQRPAPGSWELALWQVPEGSSEPQEGSQRARRVRPCIGCGAAIPASDCGPPDCSESWEIRHTFGDHRRCSGFGFAHACDIADRWHDDIRARASAALTGSPAGSVAVLCIACGESPRVLGIFPTLWDAKGRRNAHRRMHGLGVHEQKGTIYGVSVEGEFL